MTRRTVASAVAFGTLVLVGTAASAHAQEEPRDFRADRSYDTITVVGAGTAWDRPGVYGTPLPWYFIQMLDSATVAYTEAGTEQLVVADLITAEARVVERERSDSALIPARPAPFLSASRGTLRTATMDGFAAAVSPTGEILEEYRFRAADPTGIPAGVLDSGVVVEFHTADGEAGEAEIRGRGRDGSVLWTFAYPPGDGFALGDARGETVVLARDHASWLVVLSADGSLLRRTDLGLPVGRVFIDADQRIWVLTRALNAQRTGSWIVFDRDLTPVMRLTEGQIEDAWGDYAVALVPGDFDTPALALLRLRAP